MTHPHASMSIPRRSITISHSSMTLPHSSMTLGQASISFSHSSIILSQKSITFPHCPISLPHKSMALPHSPKYGCFKRMRTCFTLISRKTGAIFSLSFFRQYKVCLLESFMYHVQSIFTLSITLKDNMKSLIFHIKASTVNIEPLNTQNL